MMTLALILIPALGGVAAFIIRSGVPRRVLLVAVAIVHAILTTAAVLGVVPFAPVEGWLRLDGLGLLFLSITSILFLAASIYGVGYLARESREKRRDFEEGMLFTNAPEAIFIGCLLLFLATMTFVTVSQHFGLLWVAIEATTLSSAPLIYFHRHHRSLEATWKYLLICSVGIALALLGNFFLAVASAGHGEGRASLVLERLLQEAPGLHIPWMKAAFVCLLVGYGTKMGLAPLHTWLPDAHSESPSVVSALLSGALLNCAFLGILRAYQVCAAAGQALFAQDLLLGFGLLSMAVAAVFIMKQPDFKRLLAYSSVEHMGILSLGVGLGGAAAFGAFLHAINHSLAKAMLFFLAGNILAAYQTKTVEKVRGVLARLPVSGMLWMAGFLAITGSPPFGTFLSEFTILKAAVDQHRWWVAAGYVGFLALAFIGMSLAVLRMVYGTSRGVEGTQKESALAVVPPALLGAGVLCLGIYVPVPLKEAIEGMVRSLGGLP